MAAGTVAIGLSGFVFLSAVGHGGLEPRVAAALSSVYLLSNILGPGVFVAVEQETSRRTSASAAVGGTGALAPAGRTAGSPTGRATVVLAVLTLIVLSAIAVPLLDGVLGGNAALPVALGICVAGSAAVFHLRGVLGGRRRFRRYATGLLVDAGVRIGGVVVLTLTGSTSGAAFALALCVAPGVAALVTRTRGSVAEAVGSGLPAALGSLLTASLLGMAVANLAPVLVTAALPADPARAFAFACALVLTRAPLLMTGPVQALLLPTLATAAARGETGEVRRQLHRGLAAVGVLGVVAVPVAGLAGRSVIGLFFGRDADLLSAPAVALLTVSAVLLMAVAVVQPALVALGGYRSLITGWVSGTVVFGIVFAAVSGSDPVVAAIAATLAAPAVTLLVTLTAAWRSP